jgi:hypothetical protein
VVTRGNRTCPRVGEVRWASIVNNPWSQVPVGEPTWMHFQPANSYYNGWENREELEASAVIHVRILEPEKRPQTLSYNPISGRAGSGTVSSVDSAMAETRCSCAAMFACDGGVGRRKAPRHLLWSDSWCSQTSLGYLTRFCCPRGLLPVWTSWHRRSPTLGS